MPKGNNVPLSEYAERYIAKYIMIPEIISDRTASKKRMLAFFCFFTAFTRHANITLHVKEMYGQNTHHILEGAFKSVARSIAVAVKINPEYKDEIPSTKGVL